MRTRLCIRKELLKELDDKATELGSREKEMQSQIRGMKERTGGRSQTRHRVDDSNSPGN